MGRLLETNIQQQFKYCSATIYQLLSSNLQIAR